MGLGQWEESLPRTGVEFKSLTTGWFPPVQMRLLGRKERIHLRICGEHQTGISQKQRDEGKHQKIPGRSQKIGGVGRSAGSQEEIREFWNVPWFIEQPLKLFLLRGEISGVLLGWKRSECLFDGMF